MVAIIFSPTVVNTKIIWLKNRMIVKWTKIHGLEITNIKLAILKKIHTYKKLREKMSDLLYITDNRDNNGAMSVYPWLMLNHLPAWSDKFSLHPSSSSLFPFKMSSILGTIISLALAFVLALGFILTSSFLSL